MDRQYSSKLLFAAVIILCTGVSTCKAAQDAIQIVAKAVLCFDNHTAINKCLQQIGIVDSNVKASAQGGGHGHRGAALDTSANASAAAAASMCDTPCFEHMMMMTDCMDDILSNFKGYSAGLIKGYRAVFQMSCKVVTTAAVGSISSNGTTNATAAAAGDADDRHSPSHGSAKGGSLVSGISAAANGAGGRLRVRNLLVWLAIVMVTHLAMPSACIS